MAQSPEIQAQNRRDSAIAVAERNPFATDPEGELPVGIQLSWRLRALIASGRLAPGDRLPSVRQLADWSGVNVNTVRSVYGQLEDEGLAVTRHGLGSFVHEELAPKPALEEIAAEAILQALDAGASPRDLAIVTMVCATVPDGLPAAVPSEVVEAPASDEIEPSTAEPDAEQRRKVQRELRRQIARLEAELATHVREVELAGRPRYARQPEARVAGIEELEQVRDLLSDQLAEARQAADRRSQRQARARSRREAMLRDPESHKWDVVSAEEAGEPGCVDYSVQPRFGPLGVLMSWWRVKVSGGCPLAMPREAVREPKTAGRRAPVSAAR
jgi:DNA-binding transcriptional regulator YhcF (GntR family)